MFALNHHIEFKNKLGKKFVLVLLSSVVIESSVENLVDTAVITLPEFILNQPLKIEDKIQRGTEVSIQLGYNGNLRNEFSGYITEITNKNGGLEIHCEDALFLFRKGVKNTLFKPASLSTIASYLIQQIDPTFSLVCSFDFSYEKFTIHEAEGYDVLKKIAEETKANIYFNTEKKELHIHEPFKEKGGEVKYRPDINVENISLEYKNDSDKKVIVNIECTGADGKIRRASAGKQGGETITRQISNTKDLEVVAQNELILKSGDRYEGTIETWLIPYVAPTYTLDYEDSDYMDKAGKYYCVSVKTELSSSGGKRTVGFGKKLS